jgi:hypothetical protein
VQWDSDAPLAPGSQFLQVDPDTGLYQYSGGTDSIFQRNITVTRPFPGIPALKVTSTVTWQENTGPRSFAVEYYLYDWIK